MANLDFAKLVTDMMGAAKGALKKHWKEAKPYAEKEINSFTENLKLVAELKLKGKISEEQAKLYIDIQKSSMRIVLLTIEGLGILAVEAAINAVIDIVRDTVNKSIGWKLL